METNNIIVINNDSYFSLGETTKLLQTGYGRTKFIELLKKWGVLLERSEPSQRMIKFGYMIYHKRIIDIPGKPGKVVPVTYVTIKGLDFLRRLFNSKLKSFKGAKK
ncbi:phage antirepressor KilAC domain-containing protein [Segetibacter koreensis]|uniref:phage antirepressor KilAC domain-containing protein n=1 Tax=Segetibacter koreensis TaxID=398037 RepID=UPI000370DB0F|nr:phage antirepressor KilAC domain-containing protein [Segetibacter koreensis]